MEQEQRRIHIWISGRVQGVFFRDSTRSRAWELGLSGWVRNLRDGRVEIVAEGEAEAVQRLLEWAGQGPPHARVEQVEVEEETPQGDLAGFMVRY